MILVGPGRAPMRMLLLWGSFLISFHLLVAIDGSHHALVTPVKALELADIGGLLDVVWQIVPFFNYAHTEEVPPKLVLGSYWQEPILSVPLPGRPSCVGSCEPMVRVITVHLIHNFVRLGHVYFLPSVLETGQSQHILYWSISDRIIIIIKGEKYIFTWCSKNLSFSF